MGFSSAHTSVFVAGAASRSSSHDKGSCGKTCEIIIASTIGGVFGVVLLCLWICYMMTTWKIRRQRQRNIELTIQHMDAITSLERKLGKYLDDNAHILDMPDRRIPDYLKEHVPNLSAQELQDVILVIAARRLARDDCA